MRIKEILSNIHNEISQEVAHILAEDKQAHDFFGECRATEKLDQAVIDALVLQIKLENMGGRSMHPSGLLSDGQPTLFDLENIPTREPLQPNLL